MKILYVLDFFYPHVGGVPVVFNNITREMAKMGHDVTVVTAGAPGRQGSETWNGVKIRRFGRTREEFLLKSVLHLMGSRERYDLVHTCTYSAMIPSFIFSKMRRTPKIISVFEVWMLKEWMEFTKSKGPFYFFEERALFSLPFDAYVVASDHTRRDLHALGIPDRKIMKVLAGVDKAIFNPSVKKSRKQMRLKMGLSDSQFVGCFVGKATVFKGMDYVLDALEDAFKKIDMKFVFLLSRSHESGYKNFIRRVEGSETLRRNVTIVHPQKEHDFAARVIGACDFLLMPSLTEGFGLALAEASSIGVPVIGTKSTSLEEIIDTRTSGITVEPRSAPEISRAIQRLHGDRALRKRLSRGYRYPTWKEVSKEYVKVYQHVIRKHKEAVA